MKRILAAVAALAVIALLALPKLVQTDKLANAAVGAGSDTLSVDAFVTSTGVLENRIVTTGTVRANESVDLVSEASGKITQIHFREGSAVGKGQLLVKINDADLQAQLERAKVRLSLAEKKEARNRQLLERGSISQQEYDLALNEAQVLEAELRVIQAQIDKTEIRAPFDGVIGLRYVSEGSFISPQTRIGLLQSLNPVKIDFTIPEKYAGRVRAGDEITFRVAGLGQSFRGEVYAVEPSVRQETRSLQLRALSPNRDRALLPGAFADVELLIDRIDDALVVPSIAVMPELNGKKVFLFEGGKVTPRSVDTGIRTDETVQVVSGISPGDTVIVSGIQMVRPGQPVKVASIDS